MNHIRKFVCVPPERGHKLRLLEVADPPTTLGEWPKAACLDNAATAEDVDALLRDHATTLQCEVQANLVWESGDGSVVCSKRLKCKPESGDLDAGMMAEAQTLGITGTQQGWMVQQQRAIEASARLYMSGHTQQLVQASQQNRDSMQLVQVLGGLLRDSWAASHAANVELDKLRERQRRELDDAASQIREATNTTVENEESGARAELIRMVGGALTQALPFIVAQVGKMMTESAAANTNASPPPQVTSEAG